MRSRICLVAGQFDVTLAVSSGLAAWARLHEPWRIEVLSTPELYDISWLERAGYTGVVIVNARPDRLNNITCPVVCVQSDPSGAPTINVDDQAIGTLAAEHLLQCGYRRFAYFGVQASWSIARYEAFTRVLRQKRLTCMDNRTSDSWPSWTQAQQDGHVGTFLEKAKPPIAVFACSDLFARVLTDAAVDAGRAVPEEIAVLGVDNAEALCEADQVTLSSVDPGFERLGTEAARLLAAGIAGKALPRTTQLVRPTGVVQRRSTDPAAFADPEVAAAIRFIRSSTEGITVEDVCRRLSISRRQLERRFLKHVGRLPGAEIRALRITRARELLSETNLPLTQIAVRCGYEHLSSFSSAFREATGQTPSEYRRALGE